ncbi:hypothetical protein COOONC_26435 [Cooperia oncophora]
MNAVSCLLQYVIVLLILHSTEVYGSGQNRSSEKTNPSTSSTDVATGKTSPEDGYIQSSSRVNNEIFRINYYDSWFFASDSIYAIRSSIFDLKSTVAKK